MSRTYALLLAGAIAASACTAGYRSTEWLALESRVIVVGDVTATVPALAERRAVKGEPAILTVRVRRVVKGPIDGNVILVCTGPVTSCGSDEVYHTIHVGASGVFALVRAPSGDTWQIEWAGGFRPAEDAALFDAAIQRAKSFQEAYVEAWTRKAPEVHEAALRLDERFRAVSATWPMDLRRTPQVVTERLIEDAAHILRDKTVETISLALALDVGQDLLRGWSGYLLWDLALGEAWRERRGDFSRFGRARTREALETAAVPKGDIEAYMEAMEDRSFDEMLGYPFAEPGWNFELAIGPLTTDLIVRAHSYDRGSVLAACILFDHSGSSPDVLRLQHVVREFIDNPDRYQRWAGRWMASGGKDDPPLEEIFLR